MSDVTVDTVGVDRQQELKNEYIRQGDFFELAKMNGKKGIIAVCAEGKERSDQLKWALMDAKDEGNPALEGMETFDILKGGANGVAYPKDISKFNKTDEEYLREVAGRIKSKLEGFKNDDMYVVVFQGNDIPGRFTDVLKQNLDNGDDFLVIPQSTITQVMKNHNIRTQFE